MKTVAMFRVTHSVMEGNNYAGGVVTKTTDVDSLGDCKRFSKIIEVRPIMVEIGDVVDPADIDNAIRAAVAEDKFQANKRKFEKAEREYAAAKSATR